MTGTFRVELTSGASMQHALLWLAERRGSATVLDIGRSSGVRLAVGLLMSAARAVAAMVEASDVRDGSPVLIGSIQALAGGRGGAPSTLVFTGRSNPRGSRGDARDTALCLLESVEREIRRESEEAVA